MAQFATPDADLVDGGWLDEVGGAAAVHDGMIPDTPGSIGAGDDTDYAESGLAPSSDAMGFGLSNVEDPQSSSGHIMRWRRGKNSAGGAQIDLTVQLRQGYVNEGSQGTQITSQSDTNIPDSFTTTSYTLSGGEADSITDYTDLQGRIVANQV